MAYAAKTGAKHYLARYLDAAGKTQSVRGEDGRSVRFTSKREAKHAAEEQEAKIRRGTWIDPRAGLLTFAQYFEEMWLPNVSLELNSYAHYRTHFNASLKGEFGDVPLNRIRYEQVQGWVTRMEKAGVSERTVQARFRALQTILAGPQGGMSALRSRLIEHNPCAGVKRRPVPDREVTIYDEEEVDLILVTIDQYWAWLPMLASELGVRWGELMGLTTASFGVGMRSVVIARTVVEVSKELTGNGTPFAWKSVPKGRKPRDLPLDREVGMALSAMMEQRGLRPGDRLFSMPDKEGMPKRTEAWSEGLPVGRSYFRERIWRPTILKAQATHPSLPMRRIHDLRASKISWLLHAGVDLPTVQKFAGHRDLGTTQRYVGVMPEAHERILAASRRSRRIG